MFVICSVRKSNMSVASEKFVRSGTDQTTDQCDCSGLLPKLDIQCCRIAAVSVHLRRGAPKAVVRRLCVSAAVVRVFPPPAVGASRPAGLSMCRPPHPQPLISPHQSLRDLR